MLYVLEGKNVTIEPNDYDIKSQCNGCGNDFITKKLGIKMNFIFLIACRFHDFKYSKFSNCPKEVADREFYEDMKKLIKIHEKELNLIEEEALAVVAMIYYELVDNFADSSYEEYDPTAILPSFEVKRNLNVKEACIEISHNMFDDIYLPRWETLESAKKKGIVGGGYAEFS